MENPFTLRTKRAMGVFGRLVREWTLDPAARPPHSTDEDRRCVIYVDAFRSALSAAGLTEGRSGDPVDGDFAIRDGIEEVELILRQPKRFSVLLPEEDVLRQLQDQQGPLQLRLARLYAEVSPDQLNLKDNPFPPSDDSDEAATYDLVLGDDPFRTFLDPYMAAYTCSQCL